MSLDVQEVAAALPNYEVGGELGRGGWGVVLGGRHRQLDRQVAIKQLPRAFAAEEAVRSRFAVEARLTASLDHPHIVPVYDYVEADGLCLLVMELLPGGTVWSRFTAEGFTPKRAVGTILACLAGLEAAHTKNYLHRDIKPDNLMFSASGVLKVTDFGIAKMIGGDHTLATRAGEVIGTPAYIAPEQARGGDLSPATDVYAVATMLYELLSGVLPFSDDGEAMSLLFKHAFEPPRPLGELSPQTPVEIADVVMSGLATDPGARPASAETFGVALARASTSAWGPGWLTAEGTAVMGASSLVAATESMPNLPRGWAPPTVRGAAVDGPPPPPPLSSPVRPPVAARASGPALADMSAPVAELVPVEEVVVPPPKPGWLLAAGAALVVVTLLLAVVGLGSPARGGSLTRGAVTIDGTDPTSGHPVTVDLAKPVTIGIQPHAPSADGVRLNLSLLGGKLVHATSPITRAPSVESVDLGGRYLVGGALTGTVALLRSGHVVGSFAFPARTTQRAIATVSGVAPLLLLLFVLAYAESNLRSLRRGRRAFTATAGLTITGALFGVDLVGLGWLLTRQEPTVAGLIICGILGAGAGLVLGLGTVRVARRNRYQRAQRRVRAAASGRVERIYVTAERSSR